MTDLWLQVFFFKL